jgi:hypothetical protein
MSRKHISANQQQDVNVLKTMLTPEPDQSSVMKPCPNKLQFSEVITDNDIIFQQLADLAFRFSDSTHNEPEAHLCQSTTR